MHAPVPGDCKTPIHGFQRSKECVRHKGTSYRDDDDGDEGAVSDNLAAVNERLDEFARQLERLAQSQSDLRHAATSADERAPDRVADALARLDHRLDQITSEDRVAAYEIEHRNRLASPPSSASAARTPSPAGWAAQISARQRVLEGGVAAASAMTPAPSPPPAASSPPTAPSTREPGPDLTDLQQQLREITAQLSSLQEPYEHGLAALHSELAAIGRALTEAVPRQAIETLEGEVRSLAERLDRTRQAGIDVAVLAKLERGLAEVRDALHGLSPAESLAGFEEAMHALSSKIDQIAVSAQPAETPIAFKQLEQAVESLRGVVSNAASDGALAQLAAEVRGLAAQLERAITDSSAESLGRLEERIAALMESGRAVPPELEDSIRELIERLDRVQLSHGDQFALGALEDRIVSLSEKLDASDARLNHLEAIERGLADLLVHLEEMRSGGWHEPRTAPPPPEPAPAAQRSASESAASLLDSILKPPRVQTPTIPAPVLAPVAAPAPAATAAPPEAAEFRLEPAAKTMPRAQERSPTAPYLSPDTPLEPGSGAPRPKPGSPAARIAASEAVLGTARPMPTETGGKAAAIAAARAAVKAASLDMEAETSKSLRSWNAGWFRSSAHKSPMGSPASPPPASGLTSDDWADTPPSRGKRALKLLKTLLIAAAVAIIVIGAVQITIELLLPNEPAAPPATEPAKEPASSNAPRRSMPTPEEVLPTAPEGDPDTTGQTDDTPSVLDPSPVLPPKQSPAEVTGSIPPPSPQPAPAPLSLPADHSTNDTLPASLSHLLRTAVAAKNPAAEYELGVRYSEGRGVPQNLQQALHWLERAAAAGFAPAQFRLASLKEQGEGLKKDLHAARRLYIAAASKGHAKAMHNLAVLYAEGIDGNPDYKAAAKWFRKAAAYGIADSQYNLAVLYARGIGVGANLAESYKWFALAAATGDPEAAKKRDEVAARLNQQTLTAAKLAARTFTAEREPEEATSLRVPSGGWDRAPAAPAKPRQRTPASAAR